MSMFEDNSSGVYLEQRDCRPNYEEMAARLKKKIDADRHCLSGMEAGVLVGSVNLSREQSILYHGIIGMLYISLPRLEREYEELLKKIEKSK